jgi:hypothetical protein
MPKSTTFSNDFIALVFNAVAIANLADNAAASPATNLYLSLHTASPGIGGAQTTNETAYTNYVRIPVTRNAGGWTVALGAATNAALAQFAQCGVTGATISHVAVGTAVSGAGKVLYAGALSSTLAVANGIQPQFAPLALSVTES